MLSIMSHREMQVETTVRYQYIHTTLAKMKKNDNSKFWWGRRASGTLKQIGESIKCYSCFEKGSDSVLIKLKIHLSDVSEILLFGIYHLPQMKTYVHKNIQQLCSSFIQNSLKLVKAQKYISRIDYQKNGWINNGI